MASLICSAPGCRTRRSRWQIVCDRHWIELPFSLRQRVNLARCDRRWNPANWRKIRREVAKWLADNVLPNQVANDRRHRLDAAAARAQALHARILGEREEASDV